MESDELVSVLKSLNRTLEGLGLNGATTAPAGMGAIEALALEIKETGAKIVLALGEVADAIAER